jgi:hypothetical protein
MLDRPADLYDRDKWPEYIAWLTDRVAKFGPMKACGGSGKPAVTISLRWFVRPN